MRRRGNFMLLPVLGVAAFAGLGIGLMLWPGALLSVFAPLVGVVLLLVGVQVIAHTLIMWRRMMQPEFKLLQGIVNIVVGIVFILKHDVTLAFLSILTGLYVLVMAGIDFSSAAQRFKDKKPWVATVLGGAFRLVLGLLLLFAPFSQRHLWARVLGLYFVLAAAGALRVLLKEDKPAAAQNNASEDAAAGKAPGQDETPKKSDEP